MDATQKTDKLTEREKEALRAWLQHRTAKEIALDLGISHHAVEKRLKMARTKLDVGSSIEAARILAEAEAQSEEYQQPVAQTPDLPPTPDPRKPWQHPVIVFGGVTMFIATILAITPVVNLVSVDPVTTALNAGQDNTSPDAIEIQLSGSLEPAFENLDQDNSGYLETPESPFVTIAFLDPNGPFKQEGEAVFGANDDPVQLAEFYASADTDTDGRVSFREFYVWNKERLRELGIKVTSVMSVMPEQN
ncbi:MAG: LuxR C-terminal-related transcriptional regulator [Erythrobacter sp.]